MPFGQVGSAIVGNGQGQLFTVPLHQTKERLFPPAEV